MKLSVGDRLSMLQDSSGQNILAGFTPEQLASMFPRYYSEKLPSIGKSLSRVSGGKVGTTPETPSTGAPRTGGAPTTATPAPNTERPERNRPSTTSRPRPSTTGGSTPQSQQPEWMRKIEAIVPGISDPGAKAQLTGERKEVFEALKKGAIAPDDPRVAFLKDVSDNDLRAAGIQRGDQGYSVISTAASRMSKEELEKLGSSFGGARVGLKKGSQLLDAPDNPNLMMSNLGVNKSQWNAFRQSLTNIESGGGNYSIRGGASGRFAGAFQMGGQEIIETARKLGINPPPVMKDPRTGKIVGNEEFLRNSEMQEKFFDRYTYDHHLQLMRNPKYANASTEERLKILGYAHNQGAGGASKWLSTGQEGRDAFGTSGAKYYNSIGKALVDVRGAQETPKNVEEIRRQEAEKEYEQRESSLTSALVPKLPAGIDPKFAEQYERLSPAQKLKVHEAIGKLGEGDAAAGTKKFNELYQQNPRQTIATSTTTLPEGAKDISSLSGPAGLFTFKGGSATEESALDKAFRRSQQQRGKSDEEIQQFMSQRVSGLDPDMQKRMAAAAMLYKQQTGKTLNINQAFRSYDYQAFIKANEGRPEYGITKAAAPGRSVHEKGGAIDTSQATELERLGILDRVGLHRPYRHDPKEQHHVEINRNSNGMNDDELNRMLAERGVDPKTMVWRKGGITEEERRRSAAATPAQPVQSAPAQPVQGPVSASPLPTGVPDRPRTQEGTNTPTQTGQQQQQQNPMVFTTGSHSQQATADLIRKRHGENAQILGMNDIPGLTKDIRNGQTVQLFSGAGNASNIDKIVASLSSATDSNGKRLYTDEQIKQMVRNQTRIVEPYGSGLSRHIESGYVNPQNVYAGKNKETGSELLEYGAQRSNSRNHLNAAAISPQSATPAQLVQGPVSASPLPTGVPNTPVREGTNTPTQTRQKKEEPLPDASVESFAIGGETEAQGPLQAYAIDKDKMRRDDTLVTDGRGPLFTMNRDKESMQYQPDTGRVEVNNSRGEVRQRTNPSELGPESRTEDLSQTQPAQQQQTMQQPQVMEQPQSIPQPNSFDTTLSMMDDVFKTPSFKRSVAQSRFMQDSDPLGNHFGGGAYSVV